MQVGSDGLYAQWTAVVRLIIYYVVVFIVIYIISREFLSHHRTMNERVRDLRKRYIADPDYI